MHQVGLFLMILVDVPCQSLIYDLKGTPTLQNRTIWNTVTFYQIMQCTSWDTFWTFLTKHFSDKLTKAFFG